MSEPVQDRSERLVEQAVQRLRQWRLVLPSFLLLEVAQPFSFIASQGLLLCQPLLGFFVNESQIADWVDLLADRTQVEQLISRLDQEVAARDERSPRED